MPAHPMCHEPRLLRHVAGAALLCLSSVAMAQSAQQSGGASSSPTPMSSLDLASQILGVKDNSLVIANKYISGPLILDAEQRPITPVAFKVEFRDCEFADEVIVRKLDFGQSVKLQRVKFDKGLNLDRVSIKGDLQLDTVRSGEIIKLNTSQVEGDVRIKDPITTGLQVENLTANNLIVALGKSPYTTLDFARLSAGRLSVSGAAGAAAQINNLDLSNVNLKETLALQNLDLQRVTAGGLTVAKRALFLPVITIKKRLDLTSANLAGFEWSFAGPVQFPEDLEINGATFGSVAIVRVPSASKSASEVRRLRADRTDYGLAFLERAEYYEPAYSSYELALKTRGQSDRADAVYFAMRDRRRYTEFRDADSAWQKTVAGFNYLIGFGHKWLFGYGRGWVYPMIWSVLFILGGAFIFRNAEQMQKVDEQSSRAFSPIWYSLDIFVPILSLGIAKDWRPRQECRLLQFYSKFLSLIGLIFISAMLGALTGTLK